MGPLMGTPGPGSSQQSPGFRSHGGSHAVCDFLVPDVPSPHPCWSVISTATAVPIWPTGTSQGLTHGRCPVSVRCLQKWTGSGEQEGVMLLILNHSRVHR